MSKFIFNPKNLNILVIENSTSMASINHTFFSNYGFNTFVGFSIKEAREILVLNRVDYVILDLNLPDGNGLELINELKNSLIKIIVLTSEDNIYIKNIAYQKGIIDFIDKDKNFLYKISEIPKLIEQIEKNKNKNILIVDNSLSQIEKLKEILENRNYNILTTHNLKEAKILIEQNRIDLIFLDLQTQVDCYAFLIENKSDIFEKRKIRVVFLSDIIHNSLYRDAFRLGVKEILKKPYSI